MAKKIVFSPEANENLSDIVSYLVSEWSVNVGEKFLTILENKINTIKIFPLSHPSVKNNIRACLINRQITLYYRVNEIEIEVITLFDNRQNPDSLKIT